MGYMGELLLYHYCAVLDTFNIPIEKESGRYLDQNAAKNLGRTYDIELVHSGMKVSINSKS
jgi:hypothetical protein